jgi:anti-sigma regulatory factor (Ser/Thr protein kinase)
MERAARTFSSDLRQLAEIRAFVRDVCRRAWDVSVADEALAQLDLAISEAAANIVRHAYRGETGQPIEVIVDAAPDRVCVGMYHQGVEFDPAKVPPPVFDGSREGGFGLYLMAQSVDEVVHCDDGEGRRGVRLVKTRKLSDKGQVTSDE